MPLPDRTAMPAARHRRGHRRRLPAGLAAPVVAALAVAAGTAPAQAAVAQSFWTSATTPASAAVSDAGSVELGLRFSSDVAGKVTGVRFFKGTGNTGAHTGSLWDAAGNRLAAVTFAEESASGWQQAMFATPVAIRAATQYVVSYHATQGHYAFNDNYFSSSRTAGHLRAPATTAGVYRYGGTAFPSTSYHAGNYWVDVVFAAGTVAAPPPPPPATTWPGAGDTGVPAGTTLRPSGSLTVSTPGAVVSGLDVSGCITVNAANVTIRNSRVRGACTNVIQNNSTGLLVEDTEIDGLSAGSVPNGEAIGWANYTALRVDVHGTGDGLRANGDVTVQDSWIHDLYECSVCHNDGIQLTEGSAVVIRHNYISNSHGQTSTILIKGDQGSISGVRVQDNLLDGGGYTVYALNAAYPVSDVQITGNSFGRSFYPRGGYYGTDDLNTPVTWFGNVWADTGLSVPR